jgi:hypothetical protein
MENKINKFLCPLDFDMCYRKENCSFGKKNKKENEMMFEEMMSIELNELGFLLFLYFYFYLFIY